MPTTTARGERGRGHGRGGGGGCGGTGVGRVSQAAANTRALVPYVRGVLTMALAQNEELEKIMKGVVADSSGDQYTTRNLKFILWVYDHPSHKNIIVPCLLDTMNGAQEDLDAKRITATQHKMAVRLVVKTCLTQMVRTDPSTCPIKLQNLNFTIFSEYLMSLKRVKVKKKRKRKRRVVPAVPNLRIGGAPNDGVGNGEEDGNESASSSEGSDVAAPEQQFLSKSTYGSVRSALVHMYRSCGAVVPDDFQNDLALFMAGMKRKVAKQKEKNGVRAEEGKAVMPLACYKKLCELMFVSEDDECIFGHTFLTLEWNLMARSDNVVNSHTNHLEWRDDCLLYYIMRSKGDQDGTSSKEPWHVYANPVDPAICPILGLARYVLAYPEVLLGGKLFMSDDPYQIFSKVLRKVLEENEEVFNDMGIDIDTIGSHSARKGAATYCSTGSTVSPPMASICLRAGWSMGPVKEKYIHYEKAGDQYVGRVVCGLNVNSTEFAVSPPYFEFPVADGVLGGGESEAERAIKYAINELTIGSARLETQTFLLIMSCYASVCFHYAFIDTNLHDRSRIRQIPLFQQCKDE